MTLTRFRALGFLVAFALLVVAACGLWSRTIESTIVIEAGPKGGFFDQTAILVQAELKQHGIDSRIINREDTLKIIDDANDRQLIEKVQVLLNKEEARFRKVSRLLANLQSKYQ
jgi:hypothetical protein